MNICIDSLNIEYIKEGSGNISVLLLHGWGSSFEVYKGIMAALSDRCTLYALNFPGCGKSDTMESPWDLDNYCNLVLKFIEALDIKNPILIGHSHGGRVSLKLAATKAFDVPKMVLLDAAGLIPKKSMRQKMRARSLGTQGGTQGTVLCVEVTMSRRIEYHEKCFYHNFHNIINFPFVMCMQKNRLQR